MPNRWGTGGQPRRPARPHCLRENARHRRWVVAAAAAERSVVRSAHHRARTTERGVARQHRHHSLCVQTAQCEPGCRTKAERSYAGELERGSQPGSIAVVAYIARAMRSSNVSRHRFRAPARFDKDRSASRPWSAKISRPPSRHNGGFASPRPPWRRGAPPAGECARSAFSWRGSKLWLRAQRRLLPRVQVVESVSRRSRGSWGLGRLLREGAP